MAKQKNLPAGVERIVAYVPVELKQQVEQLAAKQWQSASRVVYEALIAYVVANAPRRGLRGRRGKR
jgi:hypothetical protein